MRSQLLLTLAALTAISTACSTRTELDVTSPPRRGADRITGLDIRRAGGETALDGVRLLIRPPSMSGRAPAGLHQRASTPPVVYLDGARLGDITLLGQVHYTAVTSMQFLDASTATIRYGTGHFGGALVISTFGGR